MHRKKFLFNKNSRPTKFPNLFCQETLNVSGSSSAHHQNFSTVYSAMAYVMQVWWQITLPKCTVKNSWWWAEELPETCRVSWQNKIGKLVRLLFLFKRKVDWQLVTDVSGQPVVSIPEGPADFSWTAPSFKMGSTGCPVKSVTSNLRQITSQKSQNLKFQ